MDSNLIVDNSSLDTATTLTESDKNVENIQNKKRTNDDNTNTNGINCVKRQRIEIINKKNNNKNRNPAKFRYGNYDRYYGYRNTKDFKDIRLDVFKEHMELFTGKDILDIGCNNGLVTTAVAKDFQIKQITGLDVDRKLIGDARQRLNIDRKSIKQIDSEIPSNQYPNNILFKYGNYVLSESRLLELETEQFDTILCLSVTKWIHLNFGDLGLKLAFKRMFKQLRPNGRLILEAQNWQSYKRRKKLTPDIFDNFKQIQLFPNQFDEYLIGAEIGFSSWYEMKLPKHESQGFQRPIKVFIKADVNGSTDS